MVLTDDIKKRIREDIDKWLLKSHDIMLSLKNYISNPTHDTRAEISSWLKTEYDIKGDIEECGVMLRFSINY